MRSIYYNYIHFAVFIRISQDFYKESNHKQTNKETRTYPRNKQTNIQRYVRRTLKNKGKS